MAVFGEVLLVSQLVSLHGSPLRAPSTVVLSMSWYVFSDYGVLWLEIPFTVDYWRRLRDACWKSCFHWRWGHHRNRFILHCKIVLAVVTQLPNHF